MKLWQPPPDVEPDHQPVANSDTSAARPRSESGFRLPGRAVLWRWVAKPFGVMLGAVLLLSLAWLCSVAPPWSSMQPDEPPTVTFVSADGLAIARRGGREAPVDAAKLPAHVRGAFIAIEDQRFATHYGVDPRGILRAFWRNARAGRVVEGGSTITQQLAKGAFLTSDRVVGRKVKEVALAVWLDAWLSKNDILSRYLSSVYFGDGVWGLRGAARHYFGKQPEKLSVAEAAMLAGMVKAPSRLNPVHDLAAAQARSRIVLRAMAQQGMIALPPSSIAVAKPHLATSDLPSGSYFADWVAAQVEPNRDDLSGQVTVPTTLDSRLQKAAIRAVTSILARDGGARHATQAALVAMRPDGQVVAMVGGRSYKASPFNRVTQASRQPGSAFKLAVYLTALQRGYTPDTLVENAPVSVDGWTPHNYGDRYGPPLSVRDAFAQSSNVAAVRLAERVGRENVIATAKRLGIVSPIAAGPSLALGSSGTTLLELTAAYAAVADGHYGVKPHGLPDSDGGGPVRGYGGAIDPAVREAMLDLLWTATNQGTGRAAALAIPAFGKTGTTQNHRDALYVGFAGGLVTGVWVGNDDNSPTRGVTGGTMPAQIWHDFMSQAHLNPADLPLPGGLQTAIQDRLAAQRAAEAERRRQAEGWNDEDPSSEDDTGLLHFLRPLLPRFLRGDGRDVPRGRNGDRWGDGQAWYPDQRREAPEGRNSRDDRDTRRRGDDPPGW